MISMRASSRFFCVSRPEISAICLSSSAISLRRISLRSCWLPIQPWTVSLDRYTTPTPITKAPTIAVMNSFLRFWRSSSRQGRRLILGMSVEAPYGKTAGGEQRRRVLLDALGAGAGGQLHLPERIADLGRDADPAADHVGDAGDVRAPAADEDLVRLLASAARRKKELE